MKIVLVHGNLTSIEPEWFSRIKKALASLTDLQIEAKLMPDNLLAREDIWLAELAKFCDPNTVIVGHSSGAIAAMRFAEEHQVAGLILIGAYESDLADNKLPYPLNELASGLEKVSGYFSRPWNFGQIRKNVKYIIQIAPDDDEFIPRGETLAIRDQLGVNEFITSPGGHFDYVPVLEKALYQAIQEGKFGLK